MTKYSRTLPLGIDRDTLSLLDLQLIDAKKGMTAVLNPGDKLQSGGVDHMVTDEDFASAGALSKRLSELSGAKVRVVGDHSSERYYLLFSDVENLSFRLDYVFEIHGQDRQSDDELLLDSHDKLAAKDLAKLGFPLNPVENLCPVIAGQVREDCYAAHIDYMSSAFLFSNSIDQIAALGATIESQFAAGFAIDEAALKRFFEERHFALQTYDAAVLAGARRLKGMRGER